MNEGMIIVSANKLIINGDTIELAGFNLLKQNVTFYLYSGGIVISPDWKNEKRPHCYETKLDYDRKIHDDFLIHILRDRGITNENCFIQLSDHYIESVPHKAPCIQQKKES